MTQIMHSLWQDDAGQDMAEYAVVVGAVVVLAVAVIAVFGSTIDTFVSSISL